jgi:hypothetical protein
MLTSEIINVLRKNGYRLTALDNGSYNSVEFILGIRMDEPEDVWYISQLMVAHAFVVVPEMSKDMHTLGLINVKLNAQDFESILAVY